MENRTIQKINKNGDVLEKIDIKSNLPLEKFNVLYDEITDQIYCYQKSKPKIDLYSINRKSGKLKARLLLEEVKFPKNPTVFNNWLYFIEINDASFNKLYKVKIR